MSSCVIQCRKDVAACPPHGLSTTVHRKPLAAASIPSSRQKCSRPIQSSNISFCAGDSSGELGVEGLASEDSLEAGQERMPLLARRREIATDAGERVGAAVRAERA